MTFLLIPVEWRANLQDVVEDKSKHDAPLANGGGVPTGQAERPFRFCSTTAASQVD